MSKRTHQKTGNKVIQEKRSCFVSRKGEKITLKSLATESKFPGNKKATDYEAGVFKMRYIRNYFSKYGRWPKLTKVGDVREDIMKSLTQDEWHEKEDDPWTPDLFRSICIE